MKANNLGKMFAPFHSSPPEHPLCKTLVMLHVIVLLATAENEESDTVDGTS